MSLRYGLALLLVTFTTLWAEDQPATPTPPSVGCASGLPGVPACVTSPASRKEAKPSGSIRFGAWNEVRRGMFGRS